MAGGPIYPFSAYPVTAGKVFPTFLLAIHPEGLGFLASLDADAIWRLFYRMPEVLPTGTGTMELWGQANATTGNAKLNIKWKSWGANEVPLASSLTAEGVSTSAFATTAYRLTDLGAVTLDADTIVAGELIQVDLTGETTSWTLAATLSVLVPTIVWV